MVINYYIRFSTNFYILSLRRASFGSENNTWGFLLPKTGEIANLLFNALKSGKIRVIVDCGLIVLVGIVVFRNFLLADSWPAGGDVLGFISRVYLYGNDFRWAYTWRLYSFGFPENICVVDFFYMVLYMLLRNPVFLIKIVMFLSFLLSGFSAYIFAFKYSKNNLASLSAALVYMVNQWVASQLTEAHVDILISYAVFPLIFLSFDHALRSGKIKHSLLFSLGLAFLVSGFHPECIIIYGTFILIFILVYIFYPSRSESFNLRLKKTMKVTSISLIAAFFLSFFFTFPLILGVKAPYFSPSYSYFIEETYNLSYKNFEDAISLRAVENWGYLNAMGNIYYGLALPNFPIYTLLCFIFIFSMAVSILFRMNRYTLFFTISTLVSIIISMGPFSFFWAFFVWGWNHLPYFSVFRAISRWIMITVLCHSYFVSQMVSMLVAYFKGMADKNMWKSSNFKMETKTSKKKEVKISCNNKALFSEKLMISLEKIIKRVVRFFCILVIVIVFLSGFVSCAFLFGHGLQVYAPPKSYLEPHYWVAQDKGDFKIVTVNSPETWIPDSESDFAYAGMLTDIGWWHDIGHDSSFLHDKPVLQNGGWDFSCRMFVDYLRFYLARQTLTDKMVKLLGTFGYKYIVIPCYADGKERQFFLNQKGVKIVFNKSNSLVLENEYYTPRFFTVEDHITLVGGLKSFLSLMKIESFSPNKTALIFADENPNMLESSKFLVFADSSLTDLVMLSMKNSLIKASDYGFKSWNSSKYWISLPSWGTVGRFVYWGNILTTCGNNLVKIPFRIEKDGEYDVWLRLGVASNRGKLTVTVDDLFQTEIKPQAKFWSEQTWINLTRLDMKKGNHVITLKNDGTGFNDVDSIAVIEASKFEEQKRKILETIEKEKIPILYLLEAEINFLKNSNSPWNSERLPYHDYLIFSQETGRNIAQLGNVSASTESDTLIARKAVDGDPTTRWASLKGMPQWIQIEWKEKQKIRGVKIQFEWAYARDYSIQVWNGTAWINQLIVSGNNEYQRVHFFPQTVETNKIRIYFTNAPAFNMVSIWELEVYNEEIAMEKEEIYAPREGDYQFFVRVLKGPQYGVLHLKVDNVIFNVSCYAENSTFEWLNLGSVHMTRGKHEIGIGATGNANLDMMAIVLMKEGEQLSSINELFQGDSENFVTSFKRINPCLYKIHVKAKKPFILVFSDAYHPLWKAFLEDGTEIPSINLYHVVNGFLIEKTGEFDLMVHFVGQDYVDLGYKFSLITFAAISILLIIPEKTYIKMKKKLKNFGEIIRKRF